MLRALFTNASKQIRELSNRYMGKPCRSVSSYQVSALFYARTYEERKHTSGREKYYLKKLMKAGTKESTLWDVGANIGLHSILYAKKFPQANVVAFEPMPLNFRILKENIHFNKLTNVCAYDFALGDEQGIRTLYSKMDPGWGGSSFLRGERPGETNLEVEVFPGDLLWSEREFPFPDIIKIDVEGFEMSVLRGLKRVLSERRTKIFVELHETYLKSLGHSLWSSIDAIRALAYKCVFLEKNPTGEQYHCIFIPNPK